MELVHFLFCVVIWMLISFKELDKICHIRLFNKNNIFFSLVFEVRSAHKRPQRPQELQDNKAPEQGKAVKGALQ